MSDRDIPSNEVIPEVEEAWEMVIDACQQAWPDRKPLIYSDSPTELIIEIINERDELRGQLDAAEQHVRILQAQVQSFSPETPREPPRELLESIAWEHKDTNKFERAREQLQAWLRSSPKTNGDVP